MELERYKVLNINISPPQTPPPLAVSSIHKEYWCFQCGNGGCLIELAQQLAVIMIGINNLKHIKSFSLQLSSVYKDMSEEL